MNNYSYTSPVRPVTPPEHRPPVSARPRAPHEPGAALPAPRRRSLEKVFRSHYSCCFFTSACTDRSPTAAFTTGRTPDIGQTVASNAPTIAPPLRSIPCRRRGRQSFGRRSTAPGRLDVGTISANRNPGGHEKGRRTGPLSLSLRRTSRFRRLSARPNWQDHHWRRTCEVRTNLDGPNFSFIAGAACGCAWLCANCDRIAETPGVRSH